MAVWYAFCPFGMYQLWPFDMHYGLLLYFVVIWYIFPFWYVVPRKIWQPWVQVEINIFVDLQEQV
jgi:hypothetical protein